MGTSAVHYRDCGFWTRDAELCDWLALIVLEIDSRTEHSDFLRSLRRAWALEAMNPSVGCIWVNLDTWAADDNQRQMIIKLCSAAIASLEERWQKGITVGDLIARLDPSGEVTKHNYSYLPPDTLIEFKTEGYLGKYFIKLLNGDLPYRIKAGEQQLQIRYGTAYLLLPYPRDGVWSIPLPDE